MTPSRLRTIVSVVVSVVALCLAVSHVLWPQLKIDTIVLVLLGAALLPWLAPLIGTIEAPGGWKVQFRELQARVKVSEKRSADASVSASRASRTAEAAIGAASAQSEYRAARAEDPGAEIAPPKDPVADPDSVLDGLIARYAEAVSGTGPDRTGELSRIFGSMVAVVPTLTGFDTAAALAGDDPGRRLAAYAGLYARPDPELLQPLATALAAGRDARFAQYWGIRALGLVAEQRDQPAPAAVMAALRGLAAELPDDSDRRAELDRVLASL
jgi:hypothetical protein